MRKGNWAPAKHHRNQIMLFAPSLDDMIPQDHEIRHLEELMEAIDWSEWEAEYDGHRGQPPIHPSLLAGALLYGLKEGIGSTRKLEKATGVRIDFMWFLHGRTIDHSTFAGFRTRFKDKLPGLFRQLAALAMTKDAAIELAIDGSRIRANSSRTGARTAESIERRAEQVAGQLTQALEKMEQMDLFEDSPCGSAEELEKKIDRLRQEQEKLAGALEQARNRDEAKARKGDKRRAASTRVPVTDPDAHVLKNKEGGYAPNYTPTAAVDTATGAIVDADVPAGSDEAGVVETAVDAATEMSGHKPSGVLFDSGFATGANLEGLSLEGVQVYAPSGVPNESNPAARADLSVPVPADKWSALPMQGRKRRVLSREAFIYDAENDCYWCPMARRLSDKKRKRRDSVQVAEYRCEDCTDCPLAHKCLSRGAQRRRINRDEFEPYREALKQHMNTDDARQVYRRRAPVAEGVFGHIKHVMGIRQFRLRGQEKVRTEWLWVCSAYNLAKILGSGWGAAKKLLPVPRERSWRAPHALLQAILWVTDDPGRRLAA